jgi:hypothetical protein
MIAGFATVALLPSAIAEGRGWFDPSLAFTGGAGAAGIEADRDTRFRTIEQIGEGDNPYGDVEYADPGYQNDRKKRYPIDTEKHIRAAWSYINKPRNAGKYSTDELKSIKNKIIAAWKDKIDPAGPPSATPPR